MKRICVYCGSSTGNQPVYREAAVALGAVLASRKIGLVYGGGNVGLMGVIADAVLAGGGEVIGVIPQSLAEREIAHGGVTDLRVVDSMHTRKALMWTQLGVHRKPCGLLNAGAFYSPLALFIDQAVTEGFIKPVHRQIIVVDDDPGRLVDALAQVKLPDVPKWI